MMKDNEKTAYKPPHLVITDFEPADVLLLSDGTDDNEGLWRPTGNALRLDLFNI